MRILSDVVTVNARTNIFSRAAVWRQLRHKKLVVTDGWGTKLGIPLSVTNARKHNFEIRYSQLY